MWLEIILDTISVNLDAIVIMMMLHLSVLKFLEETILQSSFYLINL